MVIRKLSPDTINKISAGEVVTRPLSVVKELLENSIDANASVIRIEYGHNITVEDDGTGVDEADFDLLCARYCTSKLSECSSNDDILKSVHTYGFRGEALASISDVSTVRVRTKTQEQAYGYILEYKKGVLVCKKKEGMNKGTTVTVANLFYGHSVRKQHFKNKRSEVVDIFRLIVGYQTALEKISFYFTVNGKNIVFPEVCPRASNNAIFYAVDVNADMLDNPFIQKDEDGKEHIYDISSSLLKLKNSSNMINEDNIKFKITTINRYFKTNNNLSYVLDDNILVIYSTSLHHQKDLVLLFFINNRFVKSSALKLKIYNLYKLFLPNRTFPLVYVELQVKGCDFNVDAMKQHILFAGEEEVFDKIYQMINIGLENGVINVCSLDKNKNETQIQTSAENLAAYTKESCDRTKQKYSENTKKCCIDEQKKNLIGHQKKNDIQERVEIENHTNRQKTNENIDMNDILALSSQNVNEKYFGSSNILDTINYSSQNTNILHEKNIENHQIDNLNGFFVRNMKYIGKINNELIFTQLNFFLMTCNFKKLLNVYFIQQIKRKRNKYQVVNTKNQQFTLDKSLVKYGIKNVKNGVQIPILNNITIDISSFKDKIIDIYIIAGCFADAVDDYESFFRTVKKVIREDDDVKDCFMVVTNLNDLYKSFKRI